VQILLTTVATEHPEAARSDSALEGTVTLHFGPNETMFGGFRAVWRPRRVLCG